MFFYFWFGIVSTWNRIVFVFLQFPGGDVMWSSKAIYVFDLNAKQYWYFVEAAKNASCFAFEIGQSSSSILVGTKFGSIFAVNLCKFVWGFLWSIHLFFHFKWTYYDFTFGHRSNEPKKTKLDTGEIDQRLKVFDDRILDIVTIPHRNGFSLCYSSKEASLCKHLHDNGQLQIVKRFFKVSAIKSILSNLIINKIAIRPQSSKATMSMADCGVNTAKFTLAVLVNDDSIYVYECVHHTNQNDDNNNNCVDAGSGFSIQLTKHIHPIEQRDLHGRQLRNRRTNDTNNSE